MNVVDIHLEGVRDEYGVALMSDLHVGAATTDHALIVKELADAKARGDRIAINGDVADLLLPRDAKRFVPSVLHPRLRGADNVVNAQLEWLVELLGPYADFIDMVGVGNHETAVARHHSVDLVELLVQALDAKVTDANHSVREGGYTGILRYHVPGVRKSFDTLYWHGAGNSSGLGGALGEFNRSGFVEGVDAAWFAHKHLRLASQVERITVGPRGPVKRTQWLLRTGAYSDPYVVPARGKKVDYVTDALLPPAGRGGLRLVIKRGAKGKPLTSRIEMS